MPASVEQYPPVLAQLVLLLEGTLHVIVQMDITPEQALDMKRRFTLPLGTLTKKFRAVSAQGGIPVDRMRR